MASAFKIILWVAVLVVIAWVGYVVLGNKEARTPTKTSTPSVSREPIKIGFIGALTGDGAEYGEPQKNALQLGVEDINQSGGIKGVPLEVIYEDGKCNGEGGANAAQKLVNVDKVKIILGGSCSSETLAALPIAEAAKTFIITGSATSPDLINTSKFFARDYPNDLTQGKVLAEAASARKWKKVAVIQEQTDYALGVIKAFSTRFAELGGSVIKKEEFASATTDYRSSLSKLKAAKPDALLIAVQTNASGERILKQLQDLKWKPKLMVSDVVGTDAKTVEKNKTALEEALFADFFFDTANVKFQSFNSTYKAKYGTEAQFLGYTTAVYDSLYLMKDGILAVGYDGEKIADWVRTVKDWNGISGKITIGSDGERTGGHVLKIIKDGKVEVAQ